MRQVIFISENIINSILNYRLEDKKNIITSKKKIIRYYFLRNFYIIKKVINFGFCKLTKFSSQLFLKYYEMKFYYIDYYCLMKFIYILFICTFYNR